MATVHESAILSGAANAAALGTLIAEAIRDELVSHAAWELVEEYDAGATMIWYVLKNLASANDFTDDWYVAIGRAKSTGKLYCLFAEGYNAGTHTLSLFSCVNGTQSANNTYTYDSKGRQTSQTQVLGNAVPTTGANACKFATLTPSGTGISYNMITYDDGFYFCTYGGFTSQWYYGAYEYLGDQSMPDDQAIMGAGSISDMSSHCGVTRSPIAVSSTKGCYATTLVTRPLSAISSDEVLGKTGDPDWKDAYHGGVTPASKYLLLLESNLGSQGGANSSDVIGWIIGAMKYARVITGLPSGLVFGDAFKLDGTLWVPNTFGSGSNALIFDTGVAY